MRLVEEAAAYPGDSEVEAKFALVLLYSREKEFSQAQRVLSELKQRYPRNRLVWLESASTWLRDERARMAERDLRLGFAKLLEDDRTRMFGEDEMWAAQARDGPGRVRLADRCTVGFGGGSDRRHDRMGTGARVGRIGQDR